MRILIVEDEIDLQEAIAEGLRINGYAVDTYDNENQNGFSPYRNEN
ncbi:TPA: hypothetical protein JRS25_003529 [Escherichia coli]|nr:hypothetical protein [Escherichia coli]